MKWLTNISHFFLFFRDSTVNVLTNFFFEFVAKCQRWWCLLPYMLWLGGKVPLTKSRGEPVQDTFMNQNYRFTTARRVSAAALAGKAAIDVGRKQYRPKQLK